MVRGKKLTWGRYFVMPWGKYEGEKLRDVARKDPQYLVWLYQQSPNKFNLDAEIAIWILDRSLKVRRDDGNRSKFRAAVMQLFCRTLDNWGELFGDSVEKFILRVKEKFESLKVEEFIAWLGAEEDGKTVLGLAKESLWDVDDTQILSTGKSQANVSALIDEVLARNRRLVLRMDESENFYEQAGVAFGDW